MTGKQVMELLDRIASGCEIIKEANACERCPLNVTCPAEEPLVDVAYWHNAKKWNEFFDLVDDLWDYMSEEDMRARIYDDAWKGERDERVINGEI